MQAWDLHPSHSGGLRLQLIDTNSQIWYIGDWPVHCIWYELMKVW